MKPPPKKATKQAKKAAKKTAKKRAPKKPPTESPPPPEIKKPEKGFGPPPPELEEIGIYRWNEITGYLEGRGVYGVEYRGPLMILCQAYEDHAAFRSNVRKIGSTIISERGTTRNPDCLNVNNAAGTIAKLSAQFGLTPVSQGKMKIEKMSDEPNEFAEFIQP